MLVRNNQSLTNMLPAHLLFKTFIKNRLEWDDPSHSTIYFIPTEQLDDHLLGIRFVITGSTGFITPFLINIEAPFFQDKYRPLEKEASLIIINEIERTLRNQAKDLAESIIRLKSFIKSTQPILDSIKSHSQSS